MKKRRIVVSDDECDDEGLRTSSINSNSSSSSSSCSSSNSVGNSISSSSCSGNGSIGSESSATLPNKKRGKKDPVATIVQCIKQGLRPESSTSLKESWSLLVNSATSIFGGTGNLTSINAKQLQSLYQLIDHHRLFNCLNEIIKAERRTVSFRVSPRMTSRAGQLTTDHKYPRQHELAVSSHLLFQAFSGPKSRKITVNGMKCTSSLECLLRIMEHEMIHLLLSCTCILSALQLAQCGGCSVGEGQKPGREESYHGPTFQSAVYHLYGHTTYEHDLITTDEIAYKDFNINVGTIVAFNMNGEKLVGKVNRVQKRVTILVQEKSRTEAHSDAREFSDGNFYRKFYVPMAECRPLKKKGGACETCQTSGRD